MRGLRIFLLSLCVGIGAYLMVCALLANASVLPAVDEIMTRHYSGNTEAHLGHFVSGFIAGGELVAVPPYLARLAALAGAFLFLLSASGLRLVLAGRSPREVFSLSFWQSYENKRDAKKKGH